MVASPYAFWVKTIEVVRLANYRRLVNELSAGDEPVRPVDIARALGISKVYAWQLENGKRTVIDSKAARLMERSAGKAEGWMDTDFDAWPFPDAELLARVEALRLDQRTEVQGVLRKLLADIDESTRGNSSGSRGGDGTRRAAA